MAATAGAMGGGAKAAASAVTGWWCGRCAAAVAQSPNELMRWRSSSVNAADCAGTPGSRRKCASALTSCGSRPFAHNKLEQQWASQSRGLRQASSQQHGVLMESASSVWKGWGWSLC